MNTHAAKVPPRSFWQRAGTVLAAWLKAPSQVASVIPSSACLLRTIANREPIRSATKIVDLGPGTGGTTAAILSYAATECKVLAIEKTPGFIRPLRAIEDARLVVEAGDAVEMERMLLVHQMSAPEVIVSGIPFSSLDPKKSRAILKTIHRDLADGGIFIAYQLRGHVADYAQEFFGRPQSVQWVWWNLPPLRVYTWRKS